MSLFKMMPGQPTPQPQNVSKSPSLNPVSFSRLRPDNTPGLGAQIAGNFLIYAKFTDEGVVGLVARDLISGAERELWGTGSAAAPASPGNYVDKRRVGVTYFELSPNKTKVVFLVVKEQNEDVVQRGEGTHIYEATVNGANFAGGSASVVNSNSASTGNRIITINYFNDNYLCLLHTNSDEFRVRYQQVAPGTANDQIAADGNTTGMMVYQLEPQIGKVFIWKSATTTASKMAYHLYSYNIDGTGETLLAEGGSSGSLCRGALPKSLVISPDGTKIAYYYKSWAADDDGAYRGFYLRIQNLDGTGAINQNEIGLGAGAIRPGGAGSAGEGGILCFTYNLGVYSVDYYGNPGTGLPYQCFTRADGKWAEKFIQWSPDGSKLACLLNSTWDWGGSDKAGSFNRPVMFFLSSPENLVNQSFLTDAYEWNSAHSGNNIDLFQWIDNDTIISSQRDKSTTSPGRRRVVKMKFNTASPWADTWIMDNQGSAGLEVDLEWGIKDGYVYYVKNSVGEYLTSSVTYSPIFRTPLNSYSVDTEEVVLPADVIRTSVYELFNVDWYKPKIYGNNLIAFNQINWLLQAVLDDGEFQYFSGFFTYSDDFTKKTFARDGYTCVEERFIVADADSVVIIQPNPKRVLG